jgi:hypothetical protein
MYTENTKEFDEKGARMTAMPVRGDRFLKISYTKLTTYKRNTKTKTQKMN